MFTDYKPRDWETDLKRAEAIARRRFNDRVGSGEWEKLSLAEQAQEIHRLLRYPRR